MAFSESALKTNFASLKVMQYVHDFGSFSEAADRLDLTQSTVSYTIARLRKTFNDPLFVRQGNGIEATPRCQLIVSHVSGLMAEFEGLANEPTFSPAQATGTVRISCNHYERIAILPDFIHAIRMQAPKLRLQFKTSNALGEEQLRRGECDILIGPIQLTGEHIYKRHLRSDAYVFIMDQSNPLASGPLDFDRIARARHLTIQFEGGWQPAYVEAIQSQGVHINSMVELSDYGDLSAYLRGSDLIACVPGKVAASLDPNLVKVNTPIAIPLEIDLFWTSRTHHSKLHAWVRQMLVDTA
ncbi:MAG: LysR family transcriptional regulator [Pseudomonadota bacterium]